jgi:hypothetical protein
MGISTTVTEKDIYQGRHNGSLRRGGNLGALITDSREMIRAALAGVEPDMTKVGAPGDILVGARAIAAFHNQLRGG